MTGSHHGADVADQLRRTSEPVTMDVQQQGICSISSVSIPTELLEYM